MKKRWGDVTSGDHRKRAVVTIEGNQYVGRIICSSLGSVPLLWVGEWVHNFAYWAETEIVD